MIFDTLDRLQYYAPPEVMKAVGPFLERCGPDTACGEYRTEHDGVFIRIMEYETRDAEDVPVEAHRLYVDVQSTLAGCEGMDVFPLEQVVPAGEYDPNNDVTFFRSEHAAPVRCNVAVGQFALFFPDDAHRPQLMTPRGKETIKKFVIKIKKELLNR